MTFFGWVGVEIFLNWRLNSSQSQFFVAAAAVEHLRPLETGACGSMSIVYISIGFERVLLA